MPRLSDLARNGFPEGEQVITISDSAETASKAGNPMIRFTGKNTDGISADWLCNLSEMGIKFLAQDLVNAGIDADIPESDPERMIAIVKATRQLVGKTVHARVTYNAGGYQNVKILAIAEAASVSDL